MEKNEIRKIGSMRDFAYFRKLRRTKKAAPLNFFNSSLFSYYISKMNNNEKSLSFDSIYINSYTISFPEEILINELKKPLHIENEILPSLSKKDINKILSKPNKKLKRDIDSMLISLKKNKKCVRYLKLNLFKEDQIRLLLSLATTIHYKKGQEIYTANTKPNKFFLVLKGQVSIKTLIPEKIKEEISKNSYRFEDIYKNVYNFQLIENYLENPILYDISDNIEEFSFVSKDNIKSDENENKRVNRNKKNVTFCYGHLKNINSNDIIKVNNKNNNKNGKIYKLKSSSKQLSVQNKNIKTTSKSNQNLNELFEIKMIKKDLTNLQNNLGCVLDSYFPGTFFGEKELMSDKLYTESAYAEIDTDLLLIDKINFEKYFSKQISYAEIVKKNFLIKYLPFLNQEQIANIRPEFHDKNEIIYTQFDYAKNFFLIYQGRGALKKINKKNIFKKKGDIIYNINNLDTMCIIDSGCLIGLESYQKEKYDNNFVIMEDNTILFRFSTNEYRNNILNYKSLYNKHKEFFNNFQNKTFYMNKPKKIKERKNYLDYEDKINEKKCSKIFEKATKFNSQKSNILSTKNTIYDKNKILNVIYNLKQNFYNKSKHKSSNYLNKSSNLNISYDKNSTLKSSNKNLNQFISKINTSSLFITTSPSNSIHKETEPSSTYQIKHKQKTKDFLNKTTQTTQNNTQSFVDKSIILNNMNEYQSEYKNFGFNIKNANLTISSDKKHKTVLSDEIMNSNKFLYVNTSNNSTQQEFYNKVKEYTELMFGKKSKKFNKFYFSDKYVSNVIEIAKEKNNIYNSGNFKVPLIGSCKKNKSVIKIKYIANKNKYVYKNIFDS